MLEKFIRASDRYTDGDEHISAPYIRRAFDLDFKPEYARIYITTPGFYELFVNGERITKGYLAPYISNPDDFITYDEYDVANLLKKGKNAIGIILGNGFANQSVVGWDFDKASFRAPLCVSMTLTANDGDKSYVLNSDESFRTAPSPITYDMYRYGTHYDARLEIDGWCEADYDDSLWDTVTEADAPHGKIVKCTAEPIVLQEQIKPLSYKKVGDFCYLKTAYRGGEDVEFSRVSEAYLYDFGVSRSGVCKLKIRGSRGQKIVMRHGEKLTDDGDFTLNSIYTYNPNRLDFIPNFQTDIYILSGKECEIYIPSFTYHGFRYVLIEGLTDEQALYDTVTFEVISSDIKRRSDFECDNATVNTLYGMTLAADTSNFHYFPTDCPHREKNGWTGDITASAEQLLLSFDCKESLKLWLKSLRHAQLESGMLPGIAPTSGWGYKWGNGPFWDASAVVVPYTVYKYDADEQILRDNADMIAKYLRYVKSMRNSDGLVSIGLGDWVQPYNRKIGILAPLELTDSMTVYNVSKKAETVFRIIGRKDDEAFARELKEEIFSSVREHLIDKETLTAAGNCQTSQAMLLYYGVFTQEQRQGAYERLIEIIHRDGDRLMCGVIGLCHIFDVLIDGGDGDLAMKMITRPDEPSYGAMIKRGATALCESLEENGLNESENHHFLGDILRIFLSRIAGLKVNPDLKSKNSLEFSPRPVRSIDYAKAEYSFDGARAVLGYKRQGEKILFFAEIPSGVMGEFLYSQKSIPLSPGHSEFLFDE